MQSALGRAVALLQRYPLPLLLPMVLAVGAGESLTRVLAGQAVSKFVHFLLVVTALFLNFLLACLAFLSIADATARSEARGERPRFGNLLDTFQYPACAHLITGLLARFAIALVVAGVVTLFSLSGGFALLRAATHHPVPRRISGPAYLWLAMVLSVVILSRWFFAIPLFAQSKGMLKAVFAASASAIQGQRSFVIVFTLFIQALCYPLLRLTSPLHPHLTDGAARYVPQLFEIIAAHAFQALVWTWWMIVITMLTMRLQGHDEPLPATPLAVA